MSSPMAPGARAVSWEAQAAKKRADTLAKIRPEWRLSDRDLERAREQRDLTGPFIQSLLLPDEVSIVSMESVDIVDSIRYGKLTAVQNNCLHEIFFDQAVERARSLDAHFADKKTVLGPLHGLPISLKDQFHVKGVDTTMGYIRWIRGNLGIKDPSRTHKVESQITSELLALGVVLYCKTSLPQTLLLGETKNNIIGQTLNPRNQNLSCGGIYLPEMLPGYTAAGSVPQRLSPPGNVAIARCTIKQETPAEVLPLAPALPLLPLSVYDHQTGHLAASSFSALQPSVSRDNRSSPHGPSPPIPRISVSSLLVCIDK
ncbi:amidase signature domain-containing protein [Lasiosphaeria ovina]|uniref:Amidase signature domain-containing protein n=1 Tax=Lasiosphaeria ovina TaxID=92902 RepID=A0AAE0K6R8_9PEZI|nr:amidase signature domain-containing protein [Lasiosphaeria ovina]